MFDRFVPDKYFKSIYDINYKALKKSGIKCLVFGLGNTLVPESVKSPTRKVKDLFEDLRDMGFRVVILSNRSKKEVTIDNTETQSRNKVLSVHKNGSSVFRSRNRVTARRR